MKTNYKYLLPALMLLLPACQREMAVLKELVSGETVEITVSMDPETKATLAESNGDMAFSAGDVIKVFDGTAVYSGVTSSTSSDGVFAMASGFNRAGTGYAGFPASLVSTITSEGVTFALPSTYEYAQVGGVNADEARVLCPMVGTYTGGAIILKQVGSVVRFYVSDVAAGSLKFTFPSHVTGTASAIQTPTGTSDGILVSGLTEAGKSITVTGVPAVPNSTSICITLPVPTGTAPQNIMLENIPADGSMPRFASAAGSSESLPRAAGYRMMFDSLNELEAIDLGLSVKWANMNVGATSETDYGDYFAWGETEPKDDYSRSTYKWGGDNLTKYNSSDGKAFLDLSDDAAHVNWGGNWRMPTREELDELLTLTKEWVTNYEGTGVAGYKFTATNGNSIFLPAAGRRIGTGLDNDGNYGYYRSSKLYTDAPTVAVFLSFYSGNAYCTAHDRCYGDSVRPVYQGDAPVLTSVEISPEEVTLSLRGTQQLTATAMDVNGNAIPGATIIWSIVEGSSASVNYAGLVTASTSTSGTTIIRATAMYNGVTETADCTVTVLGMEAVDLGLSVKWANMNVGATSETGFGDYFAWGETEPKTDYSWSTYKWGTSSSDLTKYNSSDGKTILDPEDDAAHVNWGGSWRMPTYGELLELWNTASNHSEYEWVWFDGSNSKYKGSSSQGYLITSKKLATYGNHIFLPFTGSWDGTEYYGEYEGDIEGDYWSSSMDSDLSAYVMLVRSLYQLRFGRDSRYNGYSVRPVLQGEATDIELASVEISPESATLRLDESIQLTATAKDTDGNTIPGASIIWRGSSSIANVNCTGLVTASGYGYQTGTTTISATAVYNGVSKTADCRVTVYPLASIEISPESVSLWTGETQQLSVTAFDTQGNTIPGVSVSWHRSYGTSATVNESTGLVTASEITTGKSCFNVEVTYGKETRLASCTVTVRKLGSVTLSPNSNFSLNVGATSSLTATVKDSAGNTVDDVDVVWNSSNTSVATVSNGVVTGVAPGNAVISATVTAGNVSVTSSNNPTVTVKVLPSFSIGSNKSVLFSPGNLQYRASTNTLRFAEHQYDYVGNSTNGNVYVGSVKSSNNNISSTYSGWIDLFGWATSGYNGKNPYLASSDNYEYGPSITSGEWTSDSNEWDWGYRNAIVNGSSTDPAGTWRTLTFDEWTYIVNNRSNTTVNGTPDARFTLAIVNTDGASVNGLILFPDNYSGGTPSGVTWGTINGGSSWGTQCTSSGWSALEAAGCVFLPAAGYRFGVGDYQASEQGFYWASTAKYAWNGQGLAFIPNVYSSANGNDRARGHSVRLVRDL